MRKHWNAPTADVGFARCPARLAFIAMLISVVQKSRSVRHGPKPSSACGRWDWFVAGRHLNFIQHTARPAPAAKIARIGSRPRERSTGMAISASSRGSTGSRIASFRFSSMCAHKATSAWRPASGEYSASVE